METYASLKYQLKVGTHLWARVSNEPVGYYVVMIIQLGSFPEVSIQLVAQAFTGILFKWRPLLILHQTVSSAYKCF